MSFTKHFAEGSAVFILSEEKNKTKLLTVADLKTISQTFKSEQQMMERQRRRGKREGVKGNE